MASLSGVKEINDREIEYAGARYVKTEGPAQLGDILRCDDGNWQDIEIRAFYGITISKGGVVGFYDDGGDARGLDEDYDELMYVDSDDFTVFRQVDTAPQTPQSPAEIRAAIERKRAEIAELEAQIAIKVDDYVRVVERTYNEELVAGDIAQVTVVDDSHVPYKLRAILGDKDDWARESDVVKITPAEAKAALIAQIEEAFEEAQTSA